MSNRTKNLAVFAVYSLFCLFLGIAGVLIDSVIVIGIGVAILLVVYLLLRGKDA